MSTAETSQIPAASGPADRKTASAQPSPRPRSSWDSDGDHPHPLNALSGTLLSRLLLRYGFDASQSGAVARYAGNSLVSLPFRWIDRCTSWTRTRGVEIRRPPLFIIGHWRSGTTHLHNLFSRDPQFGTLTMFHCAAPNSFLGAPWLIRPLLEHRMPKERPMDNVPFGLDAPQEEELAMARASRLSFNHTWTFPRHMRRIFDETVLFEPDAALAEQWKRTYLWLLRRLSVDQKRKPLCLKNPANTARIRQLLELFPQARFIHIYRNPYVVHRSTVNLWKNLLKFWAVQKYDMAEVEQHILYFYQRLMQRYFDDVSLIPPGQLAEIRFEDLETDPLGQIERVYRELSIEGFDAALPHVRDHVASQQDYRKNRYVFDRETIDRIDAAWGFAIRRWGYEPPEIR